MHSANFIQTPEADQCKRTVREYWLPWSF